MNSLQGSTETTSRQWQEAAVVKLNNYLLALLLLSNAFDMFLNMIVANHNAFISLQWFGGGLKTHAQCNLFVVFL